VQLLSSNRWTVATGDTNTQLALGFAESRPGAEQMGAAAAQSVDRRYSADEIRNTPAEVFLERMVRPEPGYWRFAALKALAEKATESDAATKGQILSTAIAVMKDTSRPLDQRWQCCYVISDSLYESGVPDLIEVLLHDESEIVRSVAAEALGDLDKNAKSASAHGGLLEAARHETSTRVREVLARRLGSELPAVEPRPAPVAPPIPAQIPESTPASGSPSSFAGTTNPPGGFHRGDSMYTAQQIETSSTEVFLERMVYPEEGYNQFAALNALIQKVKEASPATRKRIMSLVIATMHDRSRLPYQRWQCCKVISDSQYEPGVPDLIEVFLHDESDTVRGVAGEALSQFPESEAARQALQAAGAGAGPAAGRTPAAARSTTPAVTRAVEELAPTGPPQPPPGPAVPVAEPLPWPFPGGQEDQEIFNNYQQATDIYIHCGLDFIHPAGTPVTAVESGYVAAIYTNYPQWVTHYFFMVTPQKGGNEGWCYTHLDPRTFTFREGDFVRQGQRLGSLVDFSVGDQPGVSHLHLHYVRFSRDASGKVNVHSLLDPLYFFDWRDTEPPLFQPLRFVTEDMTRQFQADSDGVVTVSGKVEILATVADSAYPGHVGNLGVPVVMTSISDGVHTFQALVLDHRGDVGDETRVRPLYLSYDERKAFLNPDSFPRYQMLRVTKTDGDGRITARDASTCWDTTARGRDGDPLWPDGRYAANVYAWDIAGNKALAGAVVQVRNRQAGRLGRPID
ncbi:MAG: peptidoglycan DD-metalloendopeptidase family protein, partial [Armatimonadetes bacterium]|nr:peptidoglycan DD-metalloendopeptidase family protein [Armatimonadota bacterium]